MRKNVVKNPINEKTRSIEADPSNAFLPNNKLVSDWILLDHHYSNTPTGSSLLLFLTLNYHSHANNHNHYANPTTFSNIFHYHTTLIFQTTLQYKLTFMNYVYTVNDFALRNRIPVNSYHSNDFIYIYICACTCTSLFFLDLQQYIHSPYSLPFLLHCQQKQTRDPFHLPNSTLFLFSRIIQFYSSNSSKNIHIIHT